MKKKTTGLRIEIWVGGFVLIGLLALFVAILLIGQERHFFEKKYPLKTFFSKIGGLRMGAPVKLGGIDVGNVQNMFFNEQGKIEVVMNIRNRFRNQIRQDSIARISTMGLMGDKIIDITVGSAKYASLKPGETLSSEDPLEVSDIIERATPALKDLERALKNIAEFSERLETSQGQLGDLVTNLKGISDDIRHGEGTFAQLLKDKQIYQDLRTFTGSGAKMTKSLDETVERSLPKVESLVNNAEKASQELVPLLQSTRKLAGELEVTARNLQAASQDLPATVREGREAVANVNKAMKNLQGSWLLGGGAARAESAPATGSAPGRIDIYSPIPLGPAPALAPKESGK